MAPDTKKSFDRTWLVAGGMAVTLIAYIVNIEGKTLEAERANVRQDAELRAVQQNYYESRDKQTRIEAQVEYISLGIDEIKQTLKQQQNAK